MARSEFIGKRNVFKDNLIVSRVFDVFYHFICSFGTELLSQAGKLARKLPRLFIVLLIYKFFRFASCCQVFETFLITDRNLKVPHLAIRETNQIGKRFKVKESFCLTNKLLFKLLWIDQFHLLLGFCSQNWKHFQFVLCKINVEITYQQLHLDIALRHKMLKPRASKICFRDQRPAPCQLLLLAQAILKSKLTSFFRVFVQQIEVIYNNNKFIPNYQLRTKQAEKSLTYSWDLFSKISHINLHEILNFLTCRNSIERAKLTQTTGNDFHMKF